MVQPAHTAHACCFCRQKRSKCDGKNPCDRCRRWNQDCIYDDRTKETKGELRKERDELQSRDRDVDNVFQALRSGDLSEETMASLWSRTPLDQIASSLGGFSPTQGSGEQPRVRRAYEAGSSRSSIGEDLDITRPVLQSPNTTSHSSHYSTAGPSILPDRSALKILGQEGRLTGVECHPAIFKPSEEPWGLIGLKSYEVQELLNVFFDWQYIPLFAVDRNSMERDFVEGKGDSCSPALLRSVLCLACRSLDGYDTESSFYVNLGGRLLQEAKTLLYDTTDSKGGDLSDAQACGLLAIHQLGTHDKSDALVLIEKCVGMLITLVRKTSNDEVWNTSAIDWTSSLSTCLHGAIALCRIIHLFFDCLHAHSERNGSSTILRPIDKGVVEGAWFMLRIQQQPTQFQTVLRTPAVAEPAKEQHQFPALLVKLTSAVYCFLLTVDQPVVECPPELLNVYHGCLAQYSGMIVELQSLRGSRTSKLFTHLVYHFSLLCLLRRFCHVATPDAPVDFRAVCIEAAQAIVSLATSYQDLVSNRQLPVFVPLFVYAAGLVSFELARNSRSEPRPPLLQDDSNIGTETSSKGTETSMGTKNTGSSSSTSAITPLSITLSSPEQMGLMPDLDSYGKRKLEQISVSPMGHPILTLASPGVDDAIDCLGTMAEFFPVARNAREHLDRLISDAEPASSKAQDVGYRFPWESHNSPDKG